MRFFFDCIGPRSLRKSLDETVRKKLTDLRYESADPDHTEIDSVKDSCTDRNPLSAN